MAWIFSRLVLLLLMLHSLLVTCDDDVTLQSVMTLVQQQAATIQQQSASIQSLQNRVTSLEASDKQQGSSITALNARVNARVFFNAHMNIGQVDVGTNNSPIKFDGVVESAGGGYDPSSGVFTAPTAGLYVFYVKFMSHGNAETFHYAIEKAGSMVCTNSVGDINNYDKSSCSAAVHVQKGQTVFVRRTDYGHMVEGAWWCSFTGYLISADS